MEWVANSLTISNRATIRTGVTAAGAAMNGLSTYLWIGLGGFLGANTRYIVGNWISQRAGTGWPYHTFLINVTGGLAIGFILTLLTERFPGDPAWRLFLVVGFLGGYTT